MTNWGRKMMFKMTVAVILSHLFYILSYFDPPPPLLKTFTISPGCWCNIDMLDRADGDEDYRTCRLTPNTSWSFLIDFTNILHFLLHFIFIQYSIYSLL